MAVTVAYAATPSRNAQPGATLPVMPEERAVEPVQSVDRALTILEALARAGVAGVTEVAAELDVHKSTAFRLM